MHFYIIFGTNLLTGGPAQNCCFFAYFIFSKKRNIKRSPNGMKPSGAIFLEQMQTRGLRVDVKQRTGQPRGCPARPKGVGAPPTLVGPSWLHRPTYSSYIYLHTLKTSRSTRNPISTTATFCIREILSWGLRRCSAGGGIDHGGLLHQHHSLSDDV